MAKGRRGGKGRQGSGGESALTPAKEIFEAPTVNLEHVVFLRGLTRDAAKFKETVSILSRYVGTRSWSYSTVVAAARIDLKSPLLIALVRPVKEYMVKGSKTLDRFNADGKANPSVLDDADYKLDLDLFVVARKTYLLETQAWK